MILFDIKNLEFFYKPNSWKLRIDSLCLRKGETVCIKGENGSGKTTLLKILAGLYSTAQITRSSSVSFIEQHPYLFHGTVYKNIALGLSLNKTPEKLIENKISEISKILNIEHLLKKDAKKLSGGEIKLVALARGFILGREVLIIDEPTEGIDKTRISLIENFLQSLKNNKTTLIFSTHKEDLASKLACKIFVLENGILKRLIFSFLLD
jgi:energy-coupling factor transporter ATP-binding protein EcfA2